MREMKSIRRQTRAMNESIKQALEVQQDDQNNLTQVKSLHDAQLFTVNKQGNKKKREKLLKCRFKEKQQKGRSKVEQNLIKRIQNKQPAQEIKKAAELEDIWAAPPMVSNKIQQFKEFSNQAVTKVKAVIPPLAGQSFNPSAKAHKQLLSQVINEEVKQIEQDLKQSKRQQVFENKINMDYESSQESASEEDNGVQVYNAAVDRLDKKTKQERNKKISRRAQKELEKQIKQEKQFNHQLNIMQTLIKQDEIALKKEAKAQEQRVKEQQAEKLLQEKVGVVSKPAKVGRFNYKMRKTDFQLEDELAPSLRQLKAQGTDDLLHDRFDSIFRRNMVELDAPTNADKKRYRKTAYKFKNRRGGAYGTLAEKIMKKNQKLKEKNDQKESQSWLQNDMILI